MGVNAEFMFPIVDVRRDGQGIFCGPPFAESVVDCLGRESCLPRPFGNAQRLSLKCELVISTRVVHLFKVCDPCAVVGAITERIIQALKLVLSRRTWTHVGVERFEGRCPSVADRDSATAIVLERVMGWIRAANNHASPHVVFRREIHAVTNGSFAETATAPSSGTTPEPRAFGHDLTTAFTTAAPQHVTSAPRVGRLDRRESSRNDTAKVVFGVAMRMVQHPLIVGGYGS